MLKDHFDQIENVLLTRLKHSDVLGHPVIKGTAREIFVKEFLNSHLGENVGIGQGEIIDSNSKVGEVRPQFDIILYRKDYPKLHFANEVDVFLAESVIATIEVKSTLDKEGLTQAIQAARYSKNLRRDFATMWAIGSTPPAIRNYVFAYKGPVKMETASEWFKNIHIELGIKPPQMTGLPLDQRLNIPSSALDGIIVLRVGALHVDNTNLVPRGRKDDGQTIDPRSNYFINVAKTNNLLVLFVWLLEAINQVAYSVWNYSSYLPKA